MDTIFRPSNEVDKADFEQLDSDKIKRDDIEEKFKLTLIEEQQRCTKLHIPFCYKMAQTDIGKQLKEFYEKKLSGMDATLPSITKDWLSQYSDINNFEVIGEAKDEWERARSGEMKLIGHTTNYRYKGTKFHVSVFVPLADKI